MKDYIALAVPFFFLLIGIEFLVGVKKKMKLYRFSDAITNISLGIGQQVTGLFLKSFLLLGYIYLYDNHKLFTIENSFINWFLLFIGVDFFYYWFHRYSHQINAMWAAHIVHHQSEEYNLSVALRQSWFQGLFSWVFYLPLAFLGFEPVMFITIYSFNTLYQFWIHTRTIGKMGILEWIFNTPSHHRVHHGSDKKYIDKNHAGSLIIWDRMFGTFQEEGEEPVYGITTPLKSWNPVWANVHYMKDLWELAGKCTRFSDKVKVFLKPPGWLPEEMGGYQAPKEIDKTKYVKYDIPVNPVQNLYVLFQFLLGLAAGILLLFYEPKMDLLQTSISASFIILTLTACGGVFERKKWILYVETLRWLVAFTGLFVFSGSGAFYYISVSVIILAVISFVRFYGIWDLIKKESVEINTENYVQ
jgi:alkylglycerol monooxygenase